MAEVICVPTTNPTARPLGFPEKKLDLKAILYEILRVLGVMLFERNIRKKPVASDLGDFAKSGFHNQ